MVVPLISGTNLQRAATQPDPHPGDQRGSSLRGSLKFGVLEHSLCLRLNTGVPCQLAGRQLRGRQGEDRVLTEQGHRRGDCVLFYESFLKGGRCKLLTLGGESWAPPYLSCPSALMDFGEPHGTTQWRPEPLTPSHTHLHLQVPRHWCKST